MGYTPGRFDRDGSKNMNRIAKTVFAPVYPVIAEQIVELHFKDGCDALNEIVARRVFLFALDAAPIGRRDAETLGKLGFCGVGPPGL